MVRAKECSPLPGSPRDGAMSQLCVLPALVDPHRSSPCHLRKALTIQWEGLGSRQPGSGSGSCHSPPCVSGKSFNLEACHTLCVQNGDVITTNFILWDINQQDEWLCLTHSWVWYRGTTSYYGFLITHHCTQNPANIFNKFRPHPVGHGENLDCYPGLRGKCSECLLSNCSKWGHMLRWKKLQVVSANWGQGGYVARATGTAHISPLQESLVELRDWGTITHLTFTLKTHPDLLLYTRPCAEALKFNETPSLLRTWEQLLDLFWASISPLYNKGSGLS